MQELVRYVLDHVERGECKCGKCLDVGNSADPTGHTVDMVFFKIALKDDPDGATFRLLTEKMKGGDADINPFDGKEHNYLELGAWIGDQGIAMMYMGLGTALGIFDLLSPTTMLGVQGPEAIQLAQMGLLAVQASSQKGVSGVPA